MCRNFLWTGLTAILLLCFAAYAKADGFSHLQAVGNCINQSDIAAAIQSGRILENDDLPAFLGRMALWPTDPDVQSRTLPGEPPPQGLIDYIEGVGTWVFNHFSPNALPREVHLATYEHCREAWMAHFNEGGPAPVFYNFPIGYSEPVYSYDGGG